MKEEREAEMKRRKNKKKREIIDDEEDLEPDNYEGDAKQKIIEINRIISNEVISFNPFEARNLKETKLSECPNPLKRLRLEFDGEYISESAQRDDSQFANDNMKQKAMQINVSNEKMIVLNRFFQENFFLDIDNAPNKTFI
ncbi:MAG: hypothetical protein EZS28_005687 [Streblomastix strix]|uniref:Uncharacterized protein n=1 Tax=Streblomastix strix TaxID=222440 RepID=A0A5J4WWZ0_9EUKA|nr:MAG: hypothetical protein EZS28_005687 [Streblomastix strix]